MAREVAQKVWGW